MKRKATSSSQLSPPEATRRKTRADGPPEVLIPLFKQRNELERKMRARLEEDERAQSASPTKGKKPNEALKTAASSRAKIELTRHASVTSSIGHDEDAESDELNIQPHSPPSVSPKRATSTKKMSPRKAARQPSHSRLTRDDPSIAEHQDVSSTPTANSLSSEYPSRSLKANKKGKGKAEAEYREESDDAVDDATTILPETVVDSSPPRNRTQSPLKLTDNLPKALSSQFTSYLKAQKRAILRNLSHPPATLFESNIKRTSEKEPENLLPVATLTALLKGTTARGEGNSCLVLGPRACGKSRIVGQAIANVTGPKGISPIVIRLSGEAQTDDKLAMKEMARQLFKQTGKSYLLAGDDDDQTIDESTKLDDGGVSASMLTATHLPALIGTLTTLSRPTIVLLDSFDLFTNHARQALLYCLLDTVQSCRSGASRSLENDNLGAGGVAVIGITTRVDCLNLLEKRVKSRFSGRLVRVGVVDEYDRYVEVAKNLVSSKITQEAGDWCSVEYGDDESALWEEWTAMWNSNVQTFFSNKDIQRALRETFCLSKSVSVLCRMLTTVVLELSPTHPWLQPNKFLVQGMEQLCPPRFGYVKDLPYPALALLVATYHISNTGHDTVNFEMVWSSFAKQVDRTSAMPVTLDGASVGMTRVTRDVMFGAYENLISLRVFQPIGSASATIAKQYVRYRCAVERHEIKEGIEKQGNTNLKHWLKRG